MALCRACAHVLDYYQPNTVCGCANCLCANWASGSADDGSSHAFLETDAPRPGTAQGQALLSIYGVIRSLPVPDELPQRVIARIHDPIAGPSDVAATICEDPVLAMRVIKMSNSAAYVGLAPIRDLSSACARLGMKTLASLMWAIIGKPAYRAGCSAFGPLRERLWRHALAVAYCAQTVALATPSAREESWFLAGLVHDVGKVVLLDAIVTHNSPEMKDLRNSDQAVLEVLGRVHALAGLHVVQYMQLPVDIRVSTYLHHGPEKVGPGADGRGAYIVSIADHLANVFGYGVDGDARSDADIESAADAVGLARERLERISASLSATLDQQVDALQHA